MTKYILDTDVVSYLCDVKSPFHNKVLNKLKNLNDDDIVAISIITIYELTYWIKSFKDLELKRNFENALLSIKQDKDINIYILDLDGADSFSELKLLYKNFIGINNKSAKKNDLDLMIASIWLSHDAVIVSNDKIFEVLSNIDYKLKYENWLK